MFLHYLKIAYLLHDWEHDLQMCRTIVLRCESNAVKKNVHDWFQHEFSLSSTGNEYSINSTDIDASFKEFTKSERNLLMLIGIITGVAILIAVFGIYSMITLSCNQRRKEIAIRKVNGARAQEIFSLFFREYFVVTLLSCVVAFPIGVYIMQRWLEQYARRVSMEWWLFVGIFILVTLIVLASIFSRVNRAAKENPAEVVKSE